MNKPWYKDAIIYSLDVDTFLDADGDGTGDFKGLTQRLEYIAELGVNCIWLLPFYPSPLRDNGYDVMDYCNIDPNLGTIGDFRRFMEKASGLGLKVIIDLVVNHSSDQHEWFRKARGDKNSKYRDYYIWSEQKPENYPYEVAFEGEQDQVWSFDEKAGEYYLHRFYKEQPDLNIHNPEVKKEISAIIKFWTELGVSGFRIDAAHILVELDHSFDKVEENFNVLNFLNQEATSHGEIMLLAEANDMPDKIPEYFGKGDRMNVLFNFLLNQEIFLSLAQGNALAIKRVTQKINLQPEHGCWLNFIRHHDELTLDKLSEDEIQEIFRVFAPTSEMQIYGKGIRRRLHTMLNNNRKQVELVYSLNFSLPGIPMIRYGDEIGMGDDLSLPGRESVRTAMQWNDSKNGGFSEADKEKLIRPVIEKGEFGYPKLNAEQQMNNPDSFFHWMRKIIRVNRSHKELNNGVFRLIDNPAPEVLIHELKGEKRTFFAIHNLSAKPIDLPLHVLPFDTVDVILQGNGNGTGPRLEEFEYRWMIADNNQTN